MSRTALVSIVVACALFMENMDGTVIATSLPAIAADLGVDPVILKLAFTSYLLSLAVFIPISGWAADRLGARLVFQAAIVVFTLGSIGCGLSGSLTELVIARAVQGLGGAMMVPVGRLVVLRMVPKSELIGAMAYITMPALVGPLIGPPLGGFITTHLHWRWIFWINVPFGILGVVLAWLVVPALKDDKQPRLDRTGFMLTGIGLSCVIFGGTLAGRNDVPGALVAMLLAVGGVMLAIYIWHARRVTDPILDLGLLAIPTFRSSVFGGFLFRVGIGAIPFLLPLMLQLGFGLTPLQSGLLTFVAAAGALAMKATAGPILRRFGFRRVLIANAVISSAILASHALFEPTTPHWAIMSVLLVGGFLRSLQFTSLNTLAFADVEQDRMSRATSLASVAQQLSISTGVALAAVVLENLREWRGDPVLTVADFHVAFVVVAGVGLLSGLVHLQLVTEAGESLLSERSRSGERRPSA